MRFFKNRKFSFCAITPARAFWHWNVHWSCSFGLKEAKKSNFCYFCFFPLSRHNFEELSFLVFFQNFRQQIFQALGPVGRKNQKWQKFHFLASLSPKEQFSPNFDSISHFGCSWAIFKKVDFSAILSIFRQNLLVGPVFRYS